MSFSNEEQGHKRRASDRNNPHESIPQQQAALTPVVVPSATISITVGDRGGSPGRMVCSGSTVRYKDHLFVVKVFLAWRGGARGRAPGSDPRRRFAHQFGRPVQLGWGLVGDGSPSTRRGRSVDRTRPTHPDLGDDKMPRGPSADREPWPLFRCRCPAWRSVAGLGSGVVVERSDRGGATPPWSRRSVKMTLVQRVRSLQVRDAHHTQTVT